MPSSGCPFCSNIHPADAMCTGFTPPLVTEVVLLVPEFVDCEVCNQASNENGYDCTCCQDCENTSSQCTCCSRCEETESNCDCCSICESIADECDHCDRCASPMADCTCCSRCDSCQDDCDCCGNCDNTSDNCTCCGNCGRSDRDECSCRTCGDCDDAVGVDSYCSSCERCDECCGCRTCENCGDRCASYEYLDELSTVCRSCRTNAPTPPERENMPLAGDEVRCEHCDGMVPPSDICEIHRVRLNGTAVCRTCCQCPLCGHAASKCSVCKQCKDCCVCVRCSSCDQSRAAMCAVCFHCFQCCSCIRCGRYTASSQHPSHIAEVLCGDCGYCLELCSCPKCVTCQTKRGSRCNACDQCSVCCVAGGCGATERGGAAIQYKQRGLQFYSVKGIAQRRHNPTTREISVELETNTRLRPKKGLKLHTALEKWGDAVVHDGSIGDGHEINTNPSGGDQFYDHIRDLCDGFEDMGVGANEKCGMHVHVNAKDTEAADLRRIVMLYERIERALFDTCHPRRLNCNYSLKCGDFFSKNVIGANPKGFKQEIYAQLYNNGTKLGTVPKPRLQDWYAHYTRSACRGERCINTSVPLDDNRLCRDCFMKPNKQRHTGLVRQGATIKDAVAYKGHSLRYKALNLHSYFHRGSIEFRHHEGSTDYTTITSFGRICAEIINAGNRLSESAIKALPVNSRKALLAIIPTDLHPFIFAEWTRNDAIRMGRSEYKEIYLSTWGL